MPLAEPSGLQRGGRSYQVLTPVSGDDADDLTRRHRRPVAGALERSPIRVKKVTTPRHALHLDDSLEIHRGGQQRRERSRHGPCSKIPVRIPRGTDLPSRIVLFPGLSGALWTANSVRICQIGRFGALF